MPGRLVRPAAGPQGAHLWSPQRIQMGQKWASNCVLLGGVNAPKRFVSRVFSLKIAPPEGPPKIPKHGARGGPFWAPLLAKSYTSGGILGTAFRLGTEQFRSRTPPPCEPGGPILARFRLEKGRGVLARGEFWDPEMTQSWLRFGPGRRLGRMGFWAGGTGGQDED